MLAAGALVTDGPHALPVPSPVEAASFIYLALIVTAGAFVAWYTGVARLGVERAGLFAGLIPAGALLAVAAVGAGALTLPRAAGAGLVAAGVVLGLMQD